MIETVNTLKRELEDQQKQLQEKDGIIDSLKANHSGELEQIKKQNSDEVDDMIQKIDFLSKRIEDMTNQYEGPKAVYLKEIDEKNQEVQGLQTQIGNLEREIGGHVTDIERYKLQVKNLNGKVSDLNLQISKLKEQKNVKASTIEKEKLII